MFDFRGGAYLVGDTVLDSNQEHQHNADTVFIYPDLITSISGKFISGRMASGKLTHVSGLTWTSGVPFPVTVQPAYDHARTSIFSYQPSGSLCISKHPRLRDPYEMRYVFVKTSLIRNVVNKTFIDSFINIWMRVFALLPVFMVETAIK